MNVGIRFRPRLLETIKAYSGEEFRADLIAGVTVGIVALPLAMAFAIASGAPPQAGIFTAVIAGFVISALGGTKVSIGGPTGAFIVILYGIFVKYGTENLAICTIMAGVILIVMGLARLGSMIKFIPYPVTMGFTSGIAVLIFSTQIKDFFGLHADKVPSDFVEKLILFARQMHTLSWPAFSSGRRVICDHQTVAGRMATARTGIHHRVGDRNGCCRAFPGQLFRWRRLAADSEEFRKVCRCHICPRFRGKQSGIFSSRP